MWNPVPENCCIAALQQDALSAPQMGDSFSLLLPSVACQRSSQLLHLSSSFRVPPPKGFRHNRQEGDPLPSAFLLCPIQLSPIGMAKGMASSIGCSWQTYVLDGGDHSNIQGSVLTTHPVADEDICWAAVIAREEKSPLSDRAQTCGHSSIKECVP